MTTTPPPANPVSSMPTSATLDAPARSAETADRVVHDEIYLMSWDDDSPGPPGHDPRSSYVEQFWLGTLGPSTTWFLRYCVGELERTPTGAFVSLYDVAALLGIGHRGGANSQMARTITRACRFSAARPTAPGTLEIRKRLPELTRRQLHRLPEALQRRHAAVVDADIRTDDVECQQARARRLALGLVECGDGFDEAELQLGRWRFHPSIAADAVRWAWSRHHDVPASRNDGV